MKNEKLIQTALEYRKRAYAPYSGFLVGAAVEGESGKIYGGCNVENSSYGLTICAERVAVTRAVAEGERKIKAIAVATSSSELSMPCGACRQVIIEFAKEADIFCVGPDGGCISYKAKDLLPHFDDQNVFKENLRKIRENNTEK